MPHRRVSRDIAHSLPHGARRHGDTLRRRAAIRPSGESPDVTRGIGLLSGGRKTMRLANAPNEVIRWKRAHAVHRQVQTARHGSECGANARDVIRRHCIGRAHRSYCVSVHRRSAIAPRREHPWFPLRIYLRRDRRDGVDRAESPLQRVGRGNRSPVRQYRQPLRRGGDIDVAGGCELAERSISARSS